MTLYNGLFYQPMSDCASGMGFYVALMSVCLCSSIVIQVFFSAYGKVFLRTVN